MRRAPRVVRPSTRGDGSRSLSLGAGLGAALGCASIAAIAAADTMRFTDVTAASGIAMTLTSGGTPSRQILEVKGGGLAL
ncbi:MAG: hypothetical protein RL136_2049, partial [Planctomycetota bacterium]